MRYGFWLPISLCVASLAQSPSLPPTKSISSAKVYEGKLDADGLPLSGAHLCYEPGDSPCFQMPPSSPKGDPPDFYQFGLDPEMKTLRLGSGGSWMLFSATFSGGGSGTLTRFAILRRDNSGITNLLPEVALTNQSEDAIWNEPKISRFPLLITADFLWNFDAGETHFSRHFYAVTVWRFDRSKDCYVRAISYKTSKKYLGLDEADSINIITPERIEILRRLRTLTPNP